MIFQLFVRCSSMTTEAVLWHRTAEHSMQKWTVKLVVFVIRFYCSWSLLSVYKTRADCRRPWGVREMGVSSSRFTSASSSCISSRCSLQLHPITFTVSSLSYLSYTWDFKSMSKMQNLCSSHSLQFPFWMIKNKSYYAGCELIILQFCFVFL